MRKLALSIVLFLLVACGASINQRKVEFANRAFIEMVNIINAEGNNKEKMDNSRAAYKRIKEDLSELELVAHMKFIKARREYMSK